MATQHQGHRTASRFEVIGCRLGSTPATTHLGILAAGYEVELGKTVVGFFDMQPPIRIETPASARADALGWLPLSSEEDAKFASWLAYMRTQNPTVKYMALPSHRTKLDETSGEVIQWVFSCAGFVSHAYWKATALHLVDQDAIPGSDRAVVEMIWSNLLQGKSPKEQTRLLAR